MTNPTSDSRPAVKGSHTTTVSQSSRCLRVVQVLVNNGNSTGIKALLGDSQSESSSGGTGSSQNHLSEATARLHFGLPLPLPLDSDAFRYLEQNDRFRKSTASIPGPTGTTHCAWILPGERILSLRGAAAGSGGAGAPLFRPNLHGGIALIRVAESDSGDQSQGRREAFFYPLIPGLPYITAVNDVLSLPDLENEVYAVIRNETRARTDSSTDSRDSDVWNCNCNTPLPRSLDWLREFVLGKRVEISRLGAVTGSTSSTYDCVDTWIAENLERHEGLEKAVVREQGTVASPWVFRIV